MAWTATPTNRGGLHVTNSETGQHFEAADQAEIDEVLAELDRRDQEVAAAEAAKPDTSGQLNMPAEGGIVRTN